MNARGVAKYMIASPYAARKVVEDYAFPKEETPKIITPTPAKDVVWQYFRRGQDEQTLHDAIAAYGVKPISETPVARSRRLGALNAAKILLKFGQAFRVTDVRRKTCLITIEGLPVRASIDFFCKASNDGKILAMIFNVAAEVSDNHAKLEHYARVESEIAWQATRLHMPSTDEIWYVDLLSEKVVRRHKTSLKAAWRNIETTADNILIAYNTLIARRARERRLGA
jgi:hypothetical protein